MRRYLRSLTPIALGALLLSQPVAAQDKESEKDKSKLNDHEELIIKKKGDKDSKVTIEIKGDDVTVNGKPLSLYDDENIIIRKQPKGGYALIAPPHSPFTGGNNFDMGDNFMEEPGGNTAFLGVFTDKSDKGAGAKITEVTDGSSADKAGLKKGDIITKIDETKIVDPDDLTNVIRKHKPEDKVGITYDRDGKTEKTTATLGKRKSFSYHFETPRVEVPNFNFDWNMPPGNYGPGNGFSYSGRGRLGIKAQDVEEGKGAKVLDVVEESPADKAGIKEDDVITEFDGKKIDTAEELAAAAREARDKPSVKITFNRNGKSQTVEVKTPKKLRTVTM